ncbi:MAG: transglutaminase domain-containing protein [Nitrospinae bacterium]|nr:transglutaminase domain-containing protein [Nitrospinota bacterium]
MIKTLLNLVFLVIVPLAHSQSLFEGTGEREDWLGTYYQGKKMGFTKSTTRWGPDGVVMDSTVFFKISSESVDQSTTIKQTTRLDTNFRLLSFSLLQEISGHRQQVDGKLVGNELRYRTKSLGYDKEKTLEFTDKTAPSSTFLINLVLEGLKVGLRGNLQLFMEPLQMMVDLEYEVLREETLEYLGSSIDTFVILQRFSGMESTLWVAHDGTVFRETTNMGFESFKEEPEIAQKVDEAMTISSVITMSLVKPDKPVPRSQTKFDLVYRIHPVNSREALPEDHRQKVLKVEKQKDGKYITTLGVKSEPEKLGLLISKEIGELDPKYLEETAEVQSNHKMIRALARELSADSKSKWQLAKDINLWVHLNLRKEMVDTITALDALLERRGECQSHTFLFTALARASGIPTRIVNGLVYSEEYEGFLYHAWPEVFVGEWRAMDPTFGQDRADATHIKLTENSGENPFRLMEFVGKIAISWRSP